MLDMGLVTTTSYRQNHTFLFACFEKNARPTAGPNCSVALQHHAQK